MKVTDVKSRIVALVSLFGILAILLNAQDVMNSVKSSLILCFGSVVPAVFPFLVVSSFFVNSADNNFFGFASRIFEKIFGINSSGISAIITGMLCGYPVGACSACGLYEKNLISKSEAESLIAFCNNCSPLFLIGTVGCGILKNMHYGILLYAINTLSSIICGIILKPFTIRNVYRKRQNNLKYEKISFTDIVCNSTMTILKICGYIVVFSVINTLIRIFSKSVETQCITSAFFEIVGAVNTANSLIKKFSLKLAVISGSVGWSGLSVYMQIATIVKPFGLSMKKYIFCKIFSCIISFCVSYLIFFDIGNTNFTVTNCQPVFKSLVAISCFIVIITIIFNVLSKINLKKAKKICTPKL